MLSVDSRSRAQIEDLSETEIRENLLLFIESCTVGIVGTAAFIGAAWVGTRAGVGLWPVMGMGYLAYFVAVHPRGRPWCVCICV